MAGNESILTGFIKPPSPDDVANVEKRQRERLMGELSMTSLIEAEKADKVLLGFTNDHIEKLMSGYDPNDINRASFEVAYSMKLQLLFNMARRFHPLSTFGKNRLSEAKATREEFEKNIGPYTIRVDAGNVERFGTVIISDLCDEIVAKKSYAIGAIRSGEDAAVAAGALVYDIVTSGGKLTMRIKWLYVDEAFRGRGVAHSLVAEAVKTYIDSDAIDDMTVDMSLGKDWLMILGYFFNFWRFEFGTSISCEADIRIGDIRDPGGLMSRAEGVRALSDLDTSVIGDYLNKMGYTGFLTDERLWREYTDKKLSCFVGDANAPGGMLLAHRLPSGRVTVEFINSDDPDALISMISHFVMTAAKECDDDSKLIIPVCNKEVSGFIDGLATKQGGMFLVNGMLTKPISDMDEDDVDRMLSAAGDENIKMDTSIFETI